MKDSELAAIATLGPQDHAPRAGILQPEVRSGASFTFSAAAGTDPKPFLLVWFYTVDESKQKDFASKVTNFEDNLNPPPAGVSYLGTYSVSISGAAPDFEYRTVWGLSKLGDIDALNGHLGNPNQQMKDFLNAIARKPTMRSEIMGLTRLSKPATGGTA